MAPGHRNSISPSPETLSSSQSLYVGKIPVGVHFNFCRRPFPSPETSACLRRGVRKKKKGHSTIFSVATPSPYRHLSPSPIYFSTINSLRDAPLATDSLHLVTCIPYISHAYISQSRVCCVRALPRSAANDGSREEIASREKRKVF